MAPRWLEASRIPRPFILILVVWPVPPQNYKAHSAETQGRPGLCREREELGAGGQRERETKREERDRETKRGGRGEGERRKERGGRERASPPLQTQQYGEPQNESRWGGQILGAIER